LGVGGGRREHIDNKNKTRRRRKGGYIIYTNTATTGMYEAGTVVM